MNRDEQRRDRKLRSGHSLSPLFPRGEPKAFIRGVIRTPPLEDYPLQVGGASLFSTALSMQKTKKSIAKRFKLTGTGKLVRRTPGFRHLLATKSSKQKRRASKDKLVADGQARQLKRALPFGL